MSINDRELEKVIRETLGLKDTKETLKEAYVLEAEKYNLTTDLLSQKTNTAHQELLDGYVETSNHISAKLDTVDKSGANSNDSAFRSLKCEEVYNLNASFLHAYYFDNIADPTSKITMDSLAYMRLSRDFGTFDDWQQDFVACAMSSREGWAITVYNCFLDRFMNIAVDLHSIHVPMNCYPVIVIDMWEHAYYRDYLNDKKKYVFAMMKELNWDVVEARVKRADKLSKLFSKPLEV